MRILQVFDFLSLSYGGGTVDVVCKLSKALKERGHEGTVCTGDYKLDHFDSLNLQVFHSLFNRYGFYIMPSLRKLDVSKYDVIHLHCFRSYQNAVITYKARKYGVPYIIDAHGSTVESNGVKQMVRRLYDKVFGYKSLKYASRVVAETEVGIAEYQKLGVNLNKCVLIHPPIDIDEFSELPEVGLFRDKYKVKERYIVLFLGRIHWAKGIEVLLKAAEKFDDMCTVIVGQDDGYKAILKRFGNKVLFTGFLGGQDKLSALVDADILVQPSRNEAGIRPSLEAILCGTPVIVTKNTGAGVELSSFDGGWLVEYGNVHGLAVTIEGILKYYKAAKAKTLRAREYVIENLSLDKQIVKYEELYREVLR